MNNASLLIISALIVSALMLLMGDYASDFAALQRKSHPDYQAYEEVSK